MIKLTEFNDKFFDLSWQWLNDPEIARLVLAASVTKSQQIIWYKGLKARSDYIIWGITYNDMPIGASGLKHIDLSIGDAEYFGYIGEKAFWSRGLGSELMQCVFEKARMSGLTQLHLEVAKSNVRAIRLYCTCGFEKYDETDEMLMMRRYLHITENEEN